MPEEQPEAVLSQQGPSVTEAQKPEQAAPVNEPKGETSQSKLEPEPANGASETAGAKRPEITDLLSKIQELSPKEMKLMQEKLEAMGLESPVDDGGNILITYEFIETATVDAVTQAFQQALMPSSEVDMNRTSISPDKGSKKKSGDSGGSNGENEELDLTEEQQQMFNERLVALGYYVPRDRQGRLKFTRGFVDKLPEHLANEIYDTVDANYDESDYSTSEESQLHGSQRNSNEIEEVIPILGLRYSNGTMFVTNDRGEKIGYREMEKFLKKAFSDTELAKQEDLGKERDASLRAQIREEHRHEERDPGNFRKVESLLLLHEMAMKYVPEFNLNPMESDPIELFEKRPKVRDMATNVVRINEGGVPKQDLFHLFAPKEMGLRQLDSLMTLTSTIGRKLSLASLRGSLLSTHLSDLPSVFSQALLDEPSEAMLSPSSQNFDITEESAMDFMIKWLTDYMSGFLPRGTFTLTIINMVTQKQVELRVLKHYTVNQVCHIYMQYEDHPEYYVWKDIFGRVLNPTKNLVENGLVRTDEILEFQGYRRLPVIMLYFRDGFENEPPLPLNPIHALKHREPGLCRNY